MNCRSTLRRRCLGLRPPTSEGTRSTDPPTPAGELADVLAEGRRAGLTDEVELLGALYLRGEPVAEAARRLGVSPRTILNRRLAATERLRQVAA